MKIWSWKILLKWLSKSEIRTTIFIDVCSKTLNFVACKVKTGFMQKRDNAIMAVSGFHRTQIFNGLPPSFPKRNVTHLLSYSSCTEIREAVWKEKSKLHQPIIDQAHVKQGRRRRGGGGGQGARGPPPHFQKWGHKWVCSPPTFGQSKCSNFTICSYFVVKNTFFFFKIFLARFARQL